MRTARADAPADNKRHYENVLQALVGVESAPNLLQWLGVVTLRAIEVLEAAVGMDYGLKGASIYVGSAGIALMYLRLSEAGDSLPAPLLQGTLALARKYCEDAEKRLSGLVAHKRLTLLEGAPGILAVKCAIAAKHGDLSAAIRVQQEIEALAEDVLQMPRSECEILYGRCGYLQALIFALRHTNLASDRASHVMTAIVRQVLEEGLNLPARFRELTTRSVLWEWHGSFYLGGVRLNGHTSAAAHGMAGILMALVQSVPYLETAEGQRVTGCVARAVRDLLALQMPSGNFGSSVSEQKDRLVHWCHGAPGVVILLNASHDLLSQLRPPDEILLTDIKEAALRAGECIWQRGLLRKGVGLCHGISGNAYALLALHKLTGDCTWLSRAQLFAKYAADHWEELLNVPDSPLSLYEGLAGAVACWTDMSHPEKAKFPAFEL